MCLYPYCLLQASHFTVSHCSRKPRKKLVPVNEKKEEVHIGTPGLGHLQMHAAIPTTLRSPKGAGSPHVTATMNIHAHSVPLLTFVSSKILEGTLTMQVAGGTMNDGCQWGEGVPAFAIHHP